MRRLKHLILLFALFCSSYCGAQEIDSVHVDTTSFPGPTYVRIKFPHDGFRLTRFVNGGSTNSYPPLATVFFNFKECTGTPGVTYYNTILSLWIPPPTYLKIYLNLDTNTKDSTCVLRSSIRIADTFLNLYGSLPTAVQNKEIGSVSLYPNPVINHRLTIETAANGSKPITVMLYNLQGSKVASYTLTEAKTEIALPPHLPVGNYLLLLQTADGSVERKLITVQ